MIEMVNLSAWSYIYI